MLEEVSLSHIFDALHRECETRDHQRHEVLEGATGIEHSRPDIFRTKQVKSDECGADQRAEKYVARLKYRELLTSVIHERDCLTLTVVL